MPLEPGDELDGWELVAAPGHADGQLVLLKDGVLVAADHLLDRITPTVGLWPESRPDPLGDYLDALEHTIALEPRLALPGPRRADRRSGRSRARARSRTTGSGSMPRPRRSAAEPRTGYDVSFPLFGDDLKPAARRFAVAETLSHLERLVREGGARAARGRRGRFLYCRVSGRASL